MSENVALQKIAPLIHEIRGERVILDSDLSAIYGVDTRSLMQAVQMSVFVVRAFVKLREVLATHNQLADKLTELERKLGNAR